jgi:hypothetical protein
MQRAEQHPPSHPCVHHHSDSHQRLTKPTQRHVVFRCLYQAAATSMHPDNVTMFTHEITGSLSIFCATFPWATSPHLLKVNVSEELGASVEN